MNPPLAADLRLSSIPLDTSRKLGYNVTQGQDPKNLMVSLHWIGARAPAAQPGVMKSLVDKHWAEEEKGEDAGSGGSGAGGVPRITALPADSQRQAAVQMNATPPVYCQEGG